MRTKLMSMAVLLSIGVVAGASAQGAYPTRPVKIIVGFPPGVPGDVMARIMAPKLAEVLGQPVIVENKPGAGSSIGASSVAKSAPDGYTLFMSSIANTVNQSLYKLDFDFAKDLAPISLVADVPGVLVTHASGPASIAAAVAAAKAKPGEVTYGSSGSGTSTHLYGELFSLATKTKLNHSPYKGSSQVAVDLLAGRIDLMFTPAPTVMQSVKSGRLKAVAALGKQRLRDLPDVPTFTESGIPGYEAAFWFGLNAPAATPKPIIDRLNREVVKVLAMPDVKAQFLAQSIEPVTSSPEGFAAFVRQDIEKWTGVVKTAGVKPD
jgi:tripartite-type tricarboxylate transporter receptor subunit TctC